MTEARTHTTGDYQKNALYQYDTVYDLVNGKKVNEQSYYNSKKFTGYEEEKLNSGLVTDTEIRTCHVPITVTSCENK